MSQQLAEDREQAAGSFSIDLVAEDEGGGTVIIENQLETMTISVSSLLI